MLARQADGSQADNSGGKDQPALGYMFTAVIAFSLVPLAIKLVSGEQAPFLFNASWRLGVVVGCLFVLTRFYGTPFHASTLGRVRTQLFPSNRDLNAWGIPRWLVDYRMLLAVIVNCEYALLAWSVQFIDVTVSTLLFAIWPLFLVLLRDIADRKSAQNDRSGETDGDFPMRRVVEHIALAIVGLSGLSFAIAAELGGFAKFGDGIPLWSVAGLALATGAMTLSALKEFGIRRGWDLDHRRLDNGQGPDGSLFSCLVVIGVLVSSLGSALVCAGVGLGRGEILDPRSLGLAFIAGMIISTTAEVVWRKANLAGDDSSRNSLGCCILFFALLWLFASTQANVQRVDHLLLGAVFIVTANLLVSAKKVDVRRGFRALVIAVGLSGAFVYQRDDIFEAIGVTHWQWDLGGYFGAVGLSATVFTLLLAFRMARMYTRDREEASLTFAISRKLDMLVRGGVISGDIRLNIQQIDESRDRDSLDESKYRETLRCAYENARVHIGEADPQNDSDRELLVQVESELDALVRSKQGGQDLGEISAIVVFAWLTGYVTLGTRPENLQGWTLLMVELFSTLVSSIIIFLVEFIVGRGRDRNRSKFNYETGGNGGYPVAFPEDEPRQVDRWLFIIMAVVILATFVGLLGYKALG